MIGISGNGKDRYDFISLVDEIFKEGTSIDDMVSRYTNEKGFRRYLSSKCSFKSFRK